MSHFCVSSRKMNYRDTICGTKFREWLPNALVYLWGPQELVKDQGWFPSAAYIIYLLNHRDREATGILASVLCLRVQATFLCPNSLPLAEWLLFRSESKHAGRQCLGNISRSQKPRSATSLRAATFGSSDLMWISNRCFCTLVLYSSAKS